MLSIYVGLLVGAGECHFTKSCALCCFEEKILQHRSIQLLSGKYYSIRFYNSIWKCVCIFRLFTWNEWINIAENVIKANDMKICLTNRSAEKHIELFQQFHYNVRTFYFFAANVKFDRPTLWRHMYEILQQINIAIDSYFWSIFTCMCVNVCICTSCCASTEVSHHILGCSARV